MTTTDFGKNTLLWWLNAKEAEDLPVLAECDTLFNMNLFGMYVFPDLTLISVAPEDWRAAFKEKVARCPNWMSYIHVQGPIQ
jgi:hypothetical protein